MRGEHGGVGYPDGAHHGSSPYTWGTWHKANVVTVFQSILPMQGVTEHAGDGVDAFAVSIHTPYAGSDFRAASTPENIPLFQSTLPMQGVTATSGTPVKIPARFRHFISIIILKVNQKVKYGWDIQLLRFSISCEPALADVFASGSQSPVM